ncbi:MAG: hypothetical protein ACLFMW_01740 [Ectothiorhodospira sp.]
METLLQTLGTLVGREMEAEGVRLQVIEILDTHPLPRVVVGEIHGHAQIQADQHGDPRRRTRRTHTLSLLDEEGTDLHPVIRALAGPERARRLRELTLGTG